MTLAISYIIHDTLSCPDANAQHSGRRVHISTDICNVKYKSAYTCTAIVGFGILKLNALLAYYKHGYVTKTCSDVKPVVAGSVGFS